MTAKQIISAALTVHCDRCEWDPDSDTATPMFHDDEADAVVAALSDAGYLDDEFTIEQKQAVREYQAALGMWAAVTESSGPMLDRAWLEREHAQDVLRAALLAGKSTREST